MPLKEVHLNGNISVLHDVGWFVVYPLAKYNIILGKHWMEKVPHHFNHKKTTVAGWREQRPVRIEN
jgi:hypothetical protein